MRRGFPGSPTRHFPRDAPETALARWYLWRGELDPARDLLNAVIAVAERHGSDEGANAPGCYLMEVEWRTGNWDAAAAHAAAFARWGRETGYHQQGMTAYAVSLIEAGRGNIDQARELAATGARAGGSRAGLDVLGYVPVGARPARAVGR